MTGAARQDVQRRLAAIFAADVAGYSRLMSLDEVGTLRALTAFREIMDRLISEHGGRIANTAGDSVLAEFPSAVDAVQCAVTVQERLAEANKDVPKDRRVQFRVGVHVGDVMVRAGDLFGDGVNIAARLQGLAAPGGVCISGEAYQYARKVLPLTFADLGPQQVKNLDDPVRAYAVVPATGPGLSSPREQPQALRLPDKPSIAVLPFTNMSADPEQDYFVDGIVEDVITSLSRVKWFFVIARNSSFTYKGRAVDIKQVGRELGVRYVLEGSIRKAGHHVRITGQLVDATTGHHVWADRYHRPVEDIFAIQDEITRQIVLSLVAQVSIAETERSRQKPPEKLDAYDYHLLARAVDRQRAVNRSAETMREVRRLYEQSLEADPTYAGAWVGLSRNYLDSWLEQYSTPPFIEEFQRESTLNKALELAERAIVLDPMLDEAYAQLGLVLHWKHRAGEAIDAFSKAFTLNPNLSYPRYGDVLVYAGRAAEAIEVVKTSMRHDPLHTPLSLGYLGHAYLMARRLDDAIEVLSTCARAVPDFRPCHVWLAAAYQLAGRTGDARASAEQVLRLEPGFTVSGWMNFVPYAKPSDAQYLAHALHAAWGEL